MNQVEAVRDKKLNNEQTDFIILNVETIINLIVQWSPFKLFWRRKSKTRESNWMFTIVTFDRKIVYNSNNE